MPPSSVLIVGASRGLGHSLVKRYAELIGGDNVYATVRSEPKQGDFPEGVHVISGVDVSKQEAGKTIVKGLNGKQVEAVVIVAGLLKPEEFGKANWEDQVQMYTICSIAPVFITEALATNDCFTKGAKLVLLTSEGGSVTLRTEGEGGGMFGHHGSKAAGNMVGKLLSYDLKPKGVAVAMVHPGFLKTEMTKGAGMEQFYDKMGAVTPDEAAVPFTDFVDGLTLEKTGKFWGIMGAKGIGNAEEVMGKEVLDHEGPLELPW